MVGSSSSSVIARDLRLYVVSILISETFRRAAVLFRSPLTGAIVDIELRKEVVKEPQSLV